MAAPTGNVPSWLPGLIAIIEEILKLFPASVKGEAQSKLDEFKSTHNL